MFNRRKMEYRKINRVVFVLFLMLFFSRALPLAWAQRQPMTVNGDVVEFKSEGREVVAQGNVEIVTQDSKMTCDSVRVFLEEKLAIADGNVVFKKEGGEGLAGDIIIYDFGAGTGTIVVPEVSMSPFYGKAALMEKLGEEKFALEGAEISTCDLEHPHYLMRCKEVKMEPGRILTAKDVRLSVLDVPVMYLPSFTQKLTDLRPRLMIIPGSSKEFGLKFLGSYRYYLNESARGLLHLDWYERKGVGTGVDLNYDTKLFGLGNAKYYRIDEADTRTEIPESIRSRDERSRLELRHRWNVSPSDTMVLEYFRQSDPLFRKDYFFREYEKETNPKSFFLYTHVYPNATLSFLTEPRVNDFDSVLQKLPEVKLETINQKILDTPFYFKSTSSAGYLASAPAYSKVTTDLGRIDTSNQLSYLFRWMGLDWSPFVGHRDVFYTKAVDRSDSLMRGLFFSGLDLSTKFFKIFNFQGRFMGLDIDKLRHVVTPSIQYRYQKDPTVSNSRIYQLDAVDNLVRQNTFTLGLDNKLQTKRNGDTVDMARLLLAADYNIDSFNGVGEGFNSLRYDFEFKPYSWWEFDSDGDFDTRSRYFRALNADFWFNVVRAKTNLGYRFKKDESSQLTAGLTCPLNPFWSMSIYERFEFKTGDLVEQEYVLDRDLHCWTMEFVVNQRAGEGITFLIGFKLKAFPEIGFDAEKSFRPPRSA